MFGSFPFLCIILLVHHIDCLGSSLSKPVIVRQSNRNTYALLGSPHTLICKAKGNPPPNYVWYQNNMPVQSYKDQPSTSNIMIQQGELLFLALSKLDEGEYYCNASNSQGWAISHNIKMSVAFLETEFLNHPQNKSANIDDTVLMECQPPNGVPRPDVSWKKNDKDLSLKDTRIKILENGNLRIDAAMRKDSGMYQCEASNRFFVKKSNKATLTVRQKPRFTKYPKNLNRHVNSNAVFECQVTGDPKPTLVWRRESENKIPPSRAHIIDDHSLRIDRVQLSDAGNYICQASNEAGQVEAVARLTILSPPSFITTPEDKIVNAGSTVTFKCQTSGLPPPAVRWNFKDLYFISNGDNKKVSGRINVNQYGQLTIAQVRKSDEGIYVCRATSPIGHIQSSARLNVTASYVKTDPDPLILIGPQNQTLPEGTDVLILPCRASSALAELHESNNRQRIPSIHWYKNNKPLSLLPSRDPRIVRLSSDSLQIVQLTIEDSGEYTCRAVLDHKISDWTAAIRVVSRNDLRAPIFIIPSKYEPPKPPLNLNVDKIGTTSAKLSWPVATIRSTNPILYRVEYSEQSLTGKGWQVAYWDVADLTCVIHNLLPETGYRFLVRSIVNNHETGPPRLTDHVAYTLNSNNEARHMNIPYLTLREKIDEVFVKDIFLRAIDTTEINVTWHIDSYTPFHLLTGYKLTYKAVPLRRCLADDQYSRDYSFGDIPMEHVAYCSLSSQYHAQREHQLNALVENGLSESAEHTIDVVTPPSTSHATVLSGLRPFVCYIVEVQPFIKHLSYGQIRGRQQQGKPVLTFDSMPSEPPGDVKVEWVFNSNTTLSVRWTPPAFDSCNGVLIKYWVHIIGNGTRSIQTQNLATNITVSDLLPTQTYTVHLSAATCRGEGIRSPPYILPPRFPIASESGTGFQSRYYHIISAIAVGALFALIAGCVLIMCRRKTAGHKSFSDSETKVIFANNHNNNNPPYEVYMPGVRQPAPLSLPPPTSYTHEQTGTLIMSHNGNGPPTHLVNNGNNCTVQPYASTSIFGQTIDRGGFPPGYYPSSAVTMTTGLNSSSNIPNGNSGTSTLGGRGRVGMHVTPAGVVSGAYGEGVMMSSRHPALDGIFPPPPPESPPPPVPKSPKYEMDTPRQCGPRRLQTGKDSDLLLGEGGSHYNQQPMVNRLDEHHYLMSRSLGVSNDYRIIAANGPASDDQSECHENEVEDDQESFVSSASDSIPPEEEDGEEEDEGTSEMGPEYGEEDGLTAPETQAFLPPPPGHHILAQSTPLTQQSANRITKSNPRVTRRH